MFQFCLFRHFLRRFAVFAALAAAGCAVRSNTSYSGSIAPDPPPEFHPHPEVPPDELATGTVEPSDAGVRLNTAPVQCNDRAQAPAAPAVRRRVQSGPPVTNYIPPEVVMRPIRARFACLRVCYERALASKPALRGRVALRMVIDEDGWVRRTSVWKDDLGDADVASCLSQELVGLQYPAPDTKITVIYPLVLEPERADAGG